MLKTRIQRLEDRRAPPLSELSDKELDDRIASVWRSLTQGQVPLGDVDGLIEYLAEIDGGVVDEDFASMMRRYTLGARPLN